MVFCKNSCGEDTQHLDQIISPLRAVQKLFASVAWATSLVSEIPQYETWFSSSQEPSQKSHVVELRFSCFPDVLHGEWALF